MMFGHLEFEPPSDFVDEGGGGSGRSVLKIVGIGCAAVLLITGILFAAGAFKMVSCCNDLVEVGAQQQGAQVRAAAFVDAANAGDWSQAHQMLTPAYQQQLDVEALEATFAPHREAMAQAVPLLDSIEPDVPQQAQEQQPQLDDLRNISSWKAAVRYFPRQGDTLVVVSLGLERLDVDSAEGTPELGVSAVEVSSRPVDVDTEPPVLAVRLLHGTLQSQNMFMAWGQLAPAFQQQGRETFDAFIAEQGELFTQSTMEVLDVRYPSGQRAVVTATLTSANGQRAVVTYDLQLQMGQWKVSGIAPLIENTPPDNTPGAPGVDAPEAAEPAAAPEGEEQARDDAAGAPGEEPGQEAAEGADPDAAK